MSNITTTEKHTAYNIALRDREKMPVVAYGCAGTSKTYSAVGAAAEWLKDKRKKVLITRPNVSFAQGNGFLPGTEREKMEPWIRPVEQSFILHGIKKSELDYEEKAGRLTYMPLEFIQGCTWDDTFIIVDECQNLTFEQIKVFLTRTGRYSKVVMCGDIAQTSPMFKNSGLKEFIDMVNVYDLPVHTIEFDRDDIVRSETCKMFITAFEDWEARKR